MAKDCGDEAWWLRQGHRSEGMTSGARIAAGALMMLIGVACGGGSGGQVVSPSTGHGGGLTACRVLNELERYRFSFSFRLFSPQPERPLDDTEVGNPPFALVPNAPTFEFSQEYEGSVVSPDRTYLVIKGRGQPALEFTYIGDKAWSKLEDQWVPAPGAAVPFPPGRVCDAVMSDPDFGGLVPVEEQLNDVATSRYQFERVESDIAGDLLGAESDMGRLNEVYELDIWLTEDGWPARLKISSEGTYPSGRTLLIELTLEIKNVNDKSIKVEPPI